MDRVLNDFYVRQYIFTYLRKTPRKQCKICLDVCVWDAKLIKTFSVYPVMDKKQFCTCMECWQDSYNGPGCTIV